MVEGQVFCPGLFSLPLQGQTCRILYNSVPPGGGSVIPCPDVQLITVHQSGKCRGNHPASGIPPGTAEDTHQFHGNSMNAGLLLQFPCSGLLHRLLLIGESAGQR